ncbi:MAG: DNA polymerase I [Clostridia bacterium]|nr:DNA polymerase I [Clostridia bacterium]
MKKMLVIDGNSILNRAFYGIRILTNKQGLCTNALFGMVNIIQKQLDALSPDYAAIAFDLHAPTFRHKMYDEYKAGRKPMPEELRMQMPYAKRMAEAMGLTVLEMEGYEADDILGTLAEMTATDENLEAYILTGDRDSLQLIGDRVKVLLAGNADTVLFDGAAFLEKYGVRADQYVDVKALMGDSSDHIPGVPGIGEKTGFSLIARFGSLDAVYEQLESADITRGVRTKLENGRESAMLSRELARICRTVPLEKSLEDIAYGGMDRPLARALFTELEFSGFLKRYELDRDEEIAQEDGTSSQSRAALPTVLCGVAELPVADTWSLALCEDGLLLCNGECIYACRDGKEALQAFLNDPSVCFICYDCKTLYQRLAARGITFFRCDLDVMLGAYAVDATSKFDLPALVLGYLGEVYREEVPLVQYVWALRAPICEKLEQTDQMRLLREIEMPLAAVLADMEMIGFKIDCQGIAKYGEALDVLAKELESRIYFAAGTEFNIKSPKQLAEILFERLGLPAAKKTKSGYSTNAEVLDRLRPYHPIIDDILDYRQVTKLKSTYVEGLLKVAGEDGRIHTEFRQTGTATGRLSSAEPNLQNIPIRTEMGRELRRFFIPKDENYMLIDADYSQIELRLLAHISDDEAMRHAFVSGADIHTSTAATVFGVAPDDVTIEMRKRAKAVNFGILYGMGDFSLSQDLHISRAEAKEYIANYLHSYPNVDRYLKDIVKLAHEKGYVTTIFGRRRYIPELAVANKMQKAAGERIAMNSPIQGTAADIIKLAMIHVHRRLSESGLDARLILQVHDELLVEVRRDQAEEALALLREEMEHAVALSVPLDVGTAMGDNWFDAK